MNTEPLTKTPKVTPVQKLDAISPVSCRPTLRPCCIYSGPLLCLYNVHHNVLQNGAVLQSCHRENIKNQNKSLILMGMASF